MFSSFKLITPRSLYKSGYFAIIDDIEDDALNKVYADNIWEAIVEVYKNDPVANLIRYFYSNIKRKKNPSDLKHELELLKIMMPTFFNYPCLKARACICQRCR